MSLNSFRTRGYRRVKDQWVQESPTTAEGDAGAEKGTEPPRTVGSTRGLRGMTPEEVVQQLRSGPDRKVRSATKGQLVEQWIFRSPIHRGWRYVNFVLTPGELHPRVVSDFTLPETKFGKGVPPAR